MTKKVGLMHGQERTFPEALTEEINRRDAGVQCEPVRLGGTPHQMSFEEYDVILDRISHEVPYYQTSLKIAALAGTCVINNPFWKLADDKFFGNTLVEKLGIAVPRTVALPQKDYVEGIEPDSLTNLAYPIDWENIVEWLGGFPLVMKPNAGGGWKSVSILKTWDDLRTAYDESETLCMMLQEFIEWQQYVRCICIGQEHINPVPWDPTLPHHERYSKARADIAPELMDKIVEQAQALNRALGYDMNTVEFAIKDGVPYAIDFTNHSPDLDRNSLTEEQFKWAVRTMADVLIDKALKPREAPEMRWNALLAGK